MLSAACGISASESGAFRCCLLPVSMLFQRNLHHCIQLIRQRITVGGIGIKEEKGVLKIHIENSYNGTLIQKGTRLLTTKKEKELHGLGLGSVENIVQKYHGEMEIEKENNTFSVRVLLYLP